MGDLDHAALGVRNHAPADHFDRKALIHEHRSVAAALRAAGYLAVRHRRAGTIALGLGERESLARLALAGHVRAGLRRALLGAI